MSAQNKGVRFYFQQLLIGCCEILASAFVFGCLVLWCFGGAFQYMASVMIEIVRAAEYGMPRGVKVRLTAEQAWAAQQSDMTPEEYYKAHVASKKSRKLRERSRLYS